MRILLSMLLLSTSGLALADAPTAAVPYPVGQFLELRRFESAVPIEFRSVRGVSTSRTGYVAVVGVDRELVRPTDGPGRILFAGEFVARVVNSGHRSGRVVLVLPEADLVAAPLFFGPARSLSAVTPTEIEGEILKLSNSPRVLPKLERTWSVGDLNELYRRAAELVIRYAPEERGTAEMYLGARP